MRISNINSDFSFENRLKIRYKETYGMISSENVDNMVSLSVVANQHLIS